MEIGKIIKGHINELLSLNDNISEKRLEICKKCPLYLKDWGGLCNPELWMHPETKETSTILKEGFYRGCGCRLQAKTTLLDAVCPCLQW